MKRFEGGAEPELDGAVFRRRTGAPVISATCGTKIPAAKPPDSASGRPTTPPDSTFGSSRRSEVRPSSRLNSVSLRTAPEHSPAQLARRNFLAPRKQAQATEAQFDRAWRAPMLSGDRFNRLDILR